MPARPRHSLFLLGLLAAGEVLHHNADLRAEERQADPRLAVREDAAAQRLIAVYLVADENSKSRSSLPLRIPGKEEVTTEVESDPILSPQHFARLEVEPVFPDKFTVSAGLNRSGAERYSEIAENHIGGEYVWVIDGVGRTKSILRYPSPGAGYGVDIDESKEESQKLQAKLKAVLAERAAEPKRESLTAAEWDGEAKNAAAAVYLDYLLQAHQGDDGWIHPGTLNYLHEQVVKRLTANPVDPQAGALHACRRSMERSGHLRPSELGALLDRVTAVDGALLTAAQGRENWLNTKFGGPPKRERPKPPKPQEPEQQNCGAEEEEVAEKKKEEAEDPSLEIFGVPFGKAPAARHPKDLPDLYEAAQDTPGKFAQRSDVFLMPLAEGIWLKYPASRGRFYVEYRADRNQPETERTYGPLEGDPFERMGLEEKMRERLQRDYSPDDYYRLRLMLRTGDKKLAQRAARLVKAAASAEGETYQRESSIHPLREILKENAARWKEHGLEGEVKAAEAKLAEFEKRIEELTVTLPDDKYLPGEVADSLLAKSVPEKDWSEPNQGLRFAVVPTATEVKAGDSLAFQIIAKNATDKPLKFPTHDLIQSARPMVKDAAGKDLRAASTFFTGLSPVQHYLLQPGEVLILVAPNLRFVAAGEKAEAGFGVSTIDAPPGKYQVHFQFGLGLGSAWARGEDGVMRKTSPAKGEWTGLVTTKPLEFTVK